MHWPVCKMLSMKNLLVYRVAQMIMLTGMALCANAAGIDEARLQAALEDLRTEMKMPGLRAAVLFEDGRLVRAATGLADVEAGIPLDHSVGMPGGSTGKTFVAALTMLLVEEGVLALDDPVSRYLGTTSWYPGLPNADRIKVRHLLSHSSGLADYPGTARFLTTMVWRVLRHRSAYFTPEELIDIARGKSGMFAPGEGFHYTDAGYLVLGRVIEAATGRTYYDLLQERILTPQQLDEIAVQDQSALPDITPGYQSGVSNLRKDGRMKYDPRSEWTGGGLVTNPTMLVRFYGALVAGRIVRPETLEQMLTQGWHNPETPGVHYGLGLFVHDHGRIFGHGGMWAGYRTHVTHFRTSGTTIAVQTNRDGGIDMLAVVARIAALADEP